MSAPGPRPPALGEPTLERAGDDFGIATTGAGEATLRVHLVGALSAAAVPRLTAGLPPSSGPSSPSAVLLDLSALTFVDDAGLEALTGFRGRALRNGVSVRAVWPHGPVLGLLDCAARAGWSPPDLSCTDVLQWHRNRRERTAGGPDS